MAGGQCGLVEAPRVYAIEVYGTPAPQGSKSFKGVHGGRGVMVESSKKVKPWREDVKAAARALIEAQAGVWAPLDGPLSLTVVFTLRKPLSAPKTRVTYPMRVPDLSKLIRSTEDALTDAGIWVDDARVVRYEQCGKAYPNEGLHALASPGAYIEIREYGG